MSDFKLTRETMEVLNSIMLEMRYPGESYQVFLEISTYTNGNLYIGLNRIEEDSAGPRMESVADLTVNLPGYLLDENEAYISHDFQKEKLAFIEKNHLGVCIGEPVRHGMASYVRVSFDQKRLEELNPVIALEKAGIMQTVPQIVNFSAEGVGTPVSLYVHTYGENNRLHIELISHEDPDCLMPFGDLSANLTEFPIKLNEAFINKDASADILNFIRENRLGKVLPYTVLSGNDEYAVVAFDLDKLAEYDPEGVEDFKNIHHLTKADDAYLETEAQQKIVSPHPHRKR